MKFPRFEVRLDYLLTSHQEGWQINSLCNPSVDAVKPLFLALESSFIYMPVNGDELVAAALRRSFDAVRRSLGGKMSFIIAHIAPSYLRAHEILDSELVLFRERSLRVNDCYFHGWTRSGEFRLLNERVNKTDEQP